MSCIPTRAWNASDQKPKFEQLNGGLFWIKPLENTDEALYVVPSISRQIHFLRKPPEMSKYVCLPLSMESNCCSQFVSFEVNAIWVSVKRGNGNGGNGVKMRWHSVARLEEKSGVRATAENTIFPQSRSSHYSTIPMISIRFPFIVVSMPLSCCLRSLDRFLGLAFSCSLIERGVFPK